MSLTTKAWLEDLHVLVEHMRTTHPNLFFALSEHDFSKAVKDIESKLPHSNREHIILEFIKLVALPSVTGGRDGHSYISALQAATGFRALPLKLYEFSDGWFVVDALTPHKKLIGKRLVGVGNTNISEVASVLNPLVSRDNAMTLKARLGNFFIIPEILHATGMTDSADAVKLKFADELTTIVQPIPSKAYESWEANQTELENFSSEYVEPTKTFWLSYNAVRAETQSGETMQRFSERCNSFLKETEVARIVVDIRKNGGGNNLTYRPLLDFLSQEILRDKLFVITSRHTFSAAGNFATELEQKTNARFVGEAMGGGINQYGDNVCVLLPNSGLEAHIASRYWQMSTADDERLTLEPDISVKVSSNDFFAGVDPVLAAILESK